MLPEMYLGPRWCSGITLASHLCGWWFRPRTLRGKDGCLQNLEQLYVLASSAHKNTRYDMTYKVLKATLKPK